MATVNAGGRQTIARKAGLVHLMEEKGLVDDPNFYVLAIYYSTLREGGDGELLVKLLRGKMTIKGATYLKKVVAP
jgi:hypothetical protein